MSGEVISRVEFDLTAGLDQLDRLERTNPAVTCGPWAASFQEIIGTLRPLMAELLRRQQERRRAELRDQREDERPSR